MKLTLPCLLLLMASVLPACSDRNEAAPPGTVHIDPQRPAVLSVILKTHQRDQDLTAFEDGLTKEGFAVNRTTSESTAQPSFTRTLTGKREGADEASIPGLLTRLKPIVPEGAELSVSLSQAEMVRRR